jgi:hypothetical protein
MSVLMVSIIVSIAAIIGYVSYKVAGPDNAVEEACEEVIKIETGTTVDLSPSEPKKVQAPIQEPVQAPIETATPGANGAGGPAQQTPSAPVV